jgi:hypothetical protein
MAPEGITICPSPVAFDVYHTSDRMTWWKKSAGWPFAGVIRFKIPLERILYQDKQPSSQYNAVSGCSAKQSMTSCFIIRIT